MFVKRASDSDVATTDRLLQQIHAENPTHWPYGLSRDHFDGGLYLIAKRASHEPVGFVGWQERSEGGRKIGYYSVGVLPEYRGQGVAKRNVAAVLTEKSAGVDEVRAMVMTSNTPSKNLARSLQGVVLLEKVAAGGKGELLKTLLTGLTGGTSTMLLQDNMMNPDETLGTQAFQFDENGKSRNLMNIVNFALGAGGAATARKGVKQMAVPGQSSRGAAKAGLGLGTMITGPIIKDLAMDSHKAVHGIDRLGKDLPAAVTKAAPKPFEIPKSLIYGGLGLGAAGVGAATLVSILKMKAREREAEAARGGRIRVTLPTKNPGDSETTIDMPSSTFPLSDALQGKLNRDTRRRLLLETRQRTRRRKPLDPNNLTPAELEDQQLQLEQEQLDVERDPVPKNFLKVASLSGYFIKRAAAAAPTVPSPPAQGTNPALRMTAQAQAAQQAAGGAQTDANPQIAQAEMAAAGAEQQAQQQMAQAEQAAQAKQMEADQAHQQELAAKDQEVFQAKQDAEIEKTQIEKAKVELELAKAKIETSQEIAQNKQDMTNEFQQKDDSAVHAMTDNRLKRISSMVAKAAAATSLLPPPTEQAVPEGTAQGINRNGFDFMARGGLAPTHLYRNSYGQLGDFLYGTFARPSLTAPSQNATVDFSSLAPGALLGSPDAYDQLLRQGTQFMKTPR